MLAVFTHGFGTSGPPPRHVPGLSDPGERRDGVQEVFVRAFEERARLAYDGLRPYKPYLLRIARNLRIDQLRASGRQERDLATAFEDHLDAAQPEDVSAEDALDFRALNAATRSYIIELDAESQRFVELRFVEELSQAEVAERMGVTRRRARTLEAQVQQGLARFLKKRGLP
ncbi:MAG TPA: sigma-70 family RNA polymerase sigma factor [Polyangiales bacterium]